MKRALDFLKPNILIIFGALLFLYFMNWLQGKEATLALGIIAVVLAVYYVAIGILGLVVGDKLPRKVFDVVSVCLFAVFMFTYFLIALIQAAQIKNFMGPTAWVIAIISLVASLGLAAMYPVAKFVNNKGVVNLGFLFAAIFVLALLLNILFNVRGDAIVLGNVNMILVGIYASFTFYLFSSMGNAEVPQKPAKEESTSEE